MKNRWDQKDHIYIYIYKPDCHIKIGFQSVPLYSDVESLQALRHDFSIVTWSTKDQDVQLNIISILIPENILMPDLTQWAHVEVKQKTTQIAGRYKMHNTIKSRQHSIWLNLDWSYRLLHHWRYSVPLGNSGLMHYHCSWQTGRSVSQPEKFPGDWTQVAFVLSFLKWVTRRAVQFMENNDIILDIYQNLM